MLVDKASDLNLGPCVRAWRSLSRCLPRNYPHTTFCGQDRWLQPKGRPGDGRNLCIRSAIDDRHHFSIELNHIDPVGADIYRNGARRISHGDAGDDLVRSRINDEKQIQDSVGDIEPVGNGVDPDPNRIDSNEIVFTWLLVLASITETLPTPDSAT